MRKIDYAIRFLLTLGLSVEALGAAMGLEADGSLFGTLFALGGLCIWLLAFSVWLFFDFGG